MLGPDLRLLSLSWLLSGSLESEMGNPTGMDPVPQFKWHLELVQYSGQPGEQIARLLLLLSQQIRTTADIILRSNQVACSRSFAGAAGKLK